MKQRRAFSLLDLIVGAFILLLSMTTLYAAVLSGSRYFIKVRDRTQAWLLAQGTIDEWGINYPPGYTMSGSWVASSINDANYLWVSPSVTQWTVTSPNGYQVDLESVGIDWNPNGLACPAYSHYVYAPTFWNCSLQKFDTNTGTWSGTTLTSPLAAPYVYPVLPMRPVTPPNTPQNGCPSGIIVTDDNSQMWVQDVANQGLIGPVSTSITTWPMTPWQWSGTGGCIGKADGSLIYMANSSGSINLLYTATNTWDTYLMPLNPQPYIGTVNQQPATNASGSIVWWTDYGLKCLRCWKPGYADPNGGWTNSMIRPSLGTVGSEMGMPRGIAMDNNGWVYVMDALYLWMAQNPPPMGGGTWNRVPLPTACQYLNAAMCANRATGVVWIETVSLNLFTYSGGSSGNWFQAY